MFLCPAESEGSTDNCSGLKAYQKTGPRLKVSSNRLREPGIELGTPGYEGIDLSTCYKFYSKYRSQTISVGRCVIPWEFSGKSAKHTFSCRKMYLA